MRTKKWIVLVQGLAVLAAACSGAPRPETAPPPAATSPYAGSAPATPSEPRLEAAPTAAAPAGTCVDPATAPAVTPPAEPDCANDTLLAYDALLVIGPHPDDEVLGFGGLEASYRAQGKPVSVIVSTDGDAYCEACRLWKTSSVTGTTCDALDLSNLASPAVDSFGEVRRGESTAAAAALGLPAPTFLGYPDTGLAAAWRNYDAGNLVKPLRRSDFSKCRDCEHCQGGYGEGPETTLTATTLIDTLHERLAATPERTLLATTHWLDAHPDHAALGNFVRAINAGLPHPRAVAYTVIHAHTKKQYAHPDCWYPSPTAVACPCAGEQGCATADTSWVSTLARHRFHPDWPWTPPDDADYGEWKQLCLSAELYQGESAHKLAAVRSYGSQLGTLARSGSHPPGLSGLMDCNGYLTSFVRQTEPFVLLTRDAAATPVGAAGGRP